jgi:hypothetical protein
MNKLPLIHALSRVALLANDLRSDVRDILVQIQDASTLSEETAERDEPTPKEETAILARWAMAVVDIRRLRNALGDATSERPREMVAGDITPYRGTCAKCGIMRSYWQPWPASVTRIVCAKCPT